ncbi:CRISPR-associated protein Cmr3 [Clostridium pasteurianum]|uniref:type III-B CRISPR module-associated Cmr3 family protein n=1 Tax=Clostridium pasteurianum TaxID=1501 RepID=UPI002260ECB6|nr:type III-B CRISPR module-associated Cmr3 family protein [Clostridium pasteurianum]UZW14963.1 CRISPR-associated protein Cmr3 [Clostridium pasteurianum]
MSKYLIKLKPIENFFFGNEINLGFHNKIKNYIVKSNCFPQQTSILGMLRKEVLVKSETIEENYCYSPEQKELNKRLTGGWSFNINSVDDQDFGVIKNLSPVFICNGKEYFMKIPKDHKKENHKKQEKYNPLKMDEHAMNTSIGLITLPIEYKGKQGISDDFINVESKDIKSFDKIFREDSRVGIRKGKNGKTEDEAYYKIISYKFSDDFQFVFTAEIDMDFYIPEIDMDFDKYSNIVKLGGEGSSFKISFEKIDNSILDKINLNTNSDKHTRLVLLSDTYIAEDIYRHCSFAISNSVEFRNIETKIDNNVKCRDYNHRFKKISKKYKFLEKGSVLYSSGDELEKLKARINSFKNLKKIGYNSFIEV